MSDKTTSMDTIVTQHFLQSYGVVCACAVRHGRRAIRVEGVADRASRRGVRRAHGRWEVRGFGDSHGSFRRPVATSPGRHRSPAVRTPRRHGRSAVLVAVGLAALVLAAPEEAEAQTATTLVSNFGRTSSGTVELFNEQAGLGIFETGVSGATLTSIELQTRGFNPVPSVTLYTGTVNTSTQEVTLDTEVATFTAPSSNLLDWFVGVSGLSLLDAQGEWLLPHQVDLFPYDAGTEEGTELSLSNPATSPQGMIASLKGTGKFSDQLIARLTFDLQLPVLAALRSCDKEKEHELHRE